MRRFKHKLLGKTDVALRDGRTLGQGTDSLSASNITGLGSPDDGPRDPDGLGLIVWSEPSVEDGPLVDIVFVHGLTGKRTKTWLADGAAQPWPKELLSKKIPEARLLTYGYNADVVNFIKFSLVKSPNTSNIAVLKKDSEVLAGIQDSFSIAITKRERLEKKPLAIHCCIEENPVQGLGRRVVEPASAHFPGYHTSSTIPADHMRMTKFQHSSQVGYERLSDRLKRWVDEIREETAFLNKDVNHPSLPHPDAPFVMPFARDEDFVGREDILASLEEGFSQSTTLGRMALAGLGGIGKSQIAIEYAYRMRKKCPARSVFWVHANNAARFEQSYRSIATAAKVPGMEDPKVDVLNLVFQWLGSGGSGDWLLILDNADVAELFFNSVAAPVTQNDAASIESPCLARFLPQTGTGSILITSRDEATAVRLTGGHKQLLRVGIMPEDDTMALLAKRLPEDPSDISAKKDLIVELDSVPLAITQASAYIMVQSPRMTVTKYLQFLRHDEKNQMNLLSKNEVDLRRDPGVPNSVIRTWQISFSQIKDQNAAAADLLSCMSMLDRQGIPEFLFYEDGHQSLDFEEAIGTLVRFSFVIEERERKVFAIHRLVQLATRRWIETYGDMERVREEALRLVWSHYPYGGFENRMTCEALEPHAQIVLSFAYDSEECALQQATILFNRGEHAWRQGRFKVAEGMAQKAVDIYKLYLDSDDPRTLASLGLLAMAYTEQGNWTEAEELEVEVLEIRKRVLGAEHPDTLTTIGDLAIVYSSQGRWEKAEKLEVEVLKIKKRVLGAEHPSTLITMSNLASTYYSQGRWAEAEELELEVLEIRKRVLGAEHPETLITMNNLASTYRDQGRWTKAEELGVEVLEIRKMVLGVEHPETLITMNNLASTYSDQGRWAEAEELELEVLQIRRRVLGAEHPDTLVSMNNLALTYTYQYQGRLKEAETLHMQVLEIRKRVSGAEHPESMTIMNNLACTYWAQDRRSEAIKLMEEVVELRKKILGANHPRTIGSIDRLASWKDA